MQRNKLYIMLILAGMLLILATGVWLATAKPASAQCGSSASSCKNCHEVQGTLSVNQDGTGWHQSHAFGDFCYLCHAGNNQATDKAEAHTGMVAPLSDINASCQQCHVDDLQERAQVYAVALGIEIGSGTTPGETSTDPVVSEPTTSEPAAGVALTNDLVVDDPNLVDYTQRYNEIVLGKRPVNWGNVILIAMIGMLALGGGGFVLKNEKLVNISFGETRNVEGEYPADVVELLPALTSLKPPSRKSLRKILDNPGKTEKVLGLIDAVVSDDKNEEAAP